MFLRVLLCIVLSFAGLSAGWAKGEYESRYLYAKPDPADAGAIVLSLTKDGPRPRRAVALGRRSGKPYLGEIAKDGASITWPHLPVDVYDLLVIGPEVFFEGIQLERKPDAEKAAAEREAVQAEINIVEAFFDRKRIERIEFEGDRCRLVLQQWREGEAVAESGAVLKGSIHSIDVFEFQKPVKGWQLVVRRQLYREEEDFRKAMAARYVPALSGIRVIKSPVTVGPVNLAEAD